MSDSNERTKAELVAELRFWWEKISKAEVDMVAGKAVEYGGNGAAIDLIQIGQDLAAISGRTVDDQMATEYGIYFYVRGKFARWTAAMVEGRPVSYDTLLDLGIYIRMAQRNREVGGWPFGPTTEEETS